MRISEESNTNTIEVIDVLSFVTKSDEILNSNIEIRNKHKFQKQFIKCSRLIGDRFCTLTLHIKCDYEI